MAIYYFEFCLDQAYPSSTCANGRRGVIGLDPMKMQDATYTMVVDSSVNTERVTDMATVFGLFIGALVVVWGAKQLLRLFTDDTER